MSAITYGDLLEVRQLSIAEGQSRIAQSPTVTAPTTRSVFGARELDADRMTIRPNGDADHA
jgi:hypothetical protein